MSKSTETIRTIDLDNAQVLVLEGARNERVRVLFGATWMTEEDQQDDTILHCGDEITLRGGRTLIEGLGPTRLQLAHPPGCTSILRAAGWRSMWRSIRRHITKLQLGQEVFFSTIRSDR